MSICSYNALVSNIGNLTLACISLQEKNAASHTNAQSKRHVSSLRKMLIARVRIIC